MMILPFKRRFGIALASLSPAMPRTDPRSDQWMSFQYSFSRA